MPACLPACKPSQLHASMCDCVQACATTCKLIHVFVFIRKCASLCYHMWARGTVCKLVQLHASLRTVCRLMQLYAGFCNCMQAVCKLMQLYASLCNCMRAYATVCKHLHAFLFIELHASLCTQRRLVRTARMLMEQLQVI